jgi:hypothetical protein
VNGLVQSSVRVAALHQQDVGDGVSAPDVGRVDLHRLTGQPLRLGVVPGLLEVEGAAGEVDAVTRDRGIPGIGHAGRDPGRPRHLADPEQLHLGEALGEQVARVVEQDALVAGDGLGDAAGGGAFERLQVEPLAVGHRRRNRLRRRQRGHDLRAVVHVARAVQHQPQHHMGKAELRVGRQRRLHVRHDRRPPVQEVVDREIERGRSIRTPGGHDVPALVVLHHPPPHTPSIRAGA